MYTAEASPFWSMIIFSKDRLRLLWQYKSHKLTGCNNNIYGRHKGLSRFRIAANSQASPVSRIIIFILIVVPRVSHCFSPHLLRSSHKDLTDPSRDAVKDLG